MFHRRAPWLSLLAAVAFLALERVAAAPPVGVDERAVIAERAKHLDKLGVSRWHEAGVRGAGMTVAVLDTGFRGYRDYLGSALPERVAVKSFRQDGDLEARNSNHGVMCGEVIHAIVPQALILFANWEPDHPETFIAAVRWCRQQGARIICCSVVMPAWSDGEGGGAVHQELAGVLGDEALAIACAGNLAPRHWSGRFTDDGHGCHAWAGSQIDNTVTPWGGERVSMELQGPPPARHSVEVIDRTRQRSVGEVLAHRGADRFSMAVRFEPEPGHSYCVRVRRGEGGTESFHLVALGAWLEHSSARGSIPFPGDGAEWLTVAAVEADGRRASYSSCGPNSPRPKPDLSAPVPFPTVCRSLAFSGTSAAAPQAAGMAALIWSRHTDWSAGRVRRMLCDSCRDLGRTGHDYETGFGRIQMPER